MWSEVGLPTWRKNSTLSKKQHRLPTSQPLMVTTVLGINSLQNNNQNFLNRSVSQSAIKIEAGDDSIQESTN